MHGLYPNLMVLLFMAAYWAIPVAVAIWVIVMLKRIRASQQSLQLKLDAIERLLQRP